MHAEHEQLEEQIHFSNVITTFRTYTGYSLSANNRRKKDLLRLPLADQAVLGEIGYKKKLQDVEQAVYANAFFLDQIVAHPEIFGHDLAAADDNDNDDAAESSSSSSRDRTGEQSPPPDAGDYHTHGHGHSHSHTHDRSQSSHAHVRMPGKRYQPTDFDMDKLRSTLKQFVRDWSEQGREERETCYKPMKDALLQHFSDTPCNERGHLRVLVPGAGLGRLAYDVASLGFSCQGNEFSHYMLLGSYFILNRTDEIGKHTIYPYVHSFSNVPSREAMLAAVTIPDVLPSSLPPTANFSLVAGDFEEVYGAENQDENEPQAGVWDAILTCFFIDTAKNIVNYLRIIHRILAPGGVWINLGPLLWHFENNSTNDTSVELDLDEVKALARKIGFQLSNETTIDTTYANNPRGMLGYVYHAAFWTATKVD